MTDRKQEAIEVLREIRRIMDNYNLGAPPWRAGKWAEYVYDRLAPLMQEEYSLPKCLKCGIVINSVKQDGACRHQYTDQRSGEERRGLDRRHCNIPKHPLSGGRIAGRRSDDNQDGPNYRARAWRINRRLLKDRRKC